MIDGLVAIFNALVNGVTGIFDAVVFSAESTLGSL